MPSQETWDAFKNLAREIDNGRFHLGNDFAKRIENYIFDQLIKNVLAEQAARERAIATED